MAQARNYLALRSDQLVNSPSLFGRLTDGLAVDSALEERIHDDIVVIEDHREGDRSVDGGNAAADVAVSLIEIAAESDRATITVEENSKLYYQNPAPGEPEFSEYWLRHEFVFVQGRSGWVLLDSTPEFAPGVLLPATQVIDTGSALEEPEVAGEAETTGRPLETAEGSGMGTMALSKANKKKVVDYAQKYVKNYNKNYRSYKQDCTNFVSQAMKSGGWKHTGSVIGRKSSTNWFYGSMTATTSYTWAGAENWGIFARDKSKRTKKITLKSLAAGDILQAAWRKNSAKDHSMIVVKTGSGGEKYLNYHSTDTKEEKLSRIRQRHPGATWYPHRT
ncbi:amidase domain-containing protein [Nocardiopsis lambiniae]|uniref:Amidase domain-containing protein n=1 Tax=Nocardiopsis lambiniae TaxID=3075539 RepID=A0ABU2M9H3_9ACTN|nr:amidase domain-containing protein [Nocardiopsis sp. DSM 44743]MDT0329218.1 amidase domain-containing protein [Nocardiopsis sp. DSM 44743]